MDDIETQLVETEPGVHESSDDDSVKKRPALPLPPEIFKESLQESGFKKSTRICLRQIREAMLRHNWQEAAEYMSSFVQCLEDEFVYSYPSREIIWRMGTEILHHHPNSKMEDFTCLYERIKHSGVKQYLLVTLEHSLHLLVNGQLEDAKRQLSMAESWRFGKVSAGQPQKMTLIQAYRGFLDYVIWCEKKSSLPSTDDPDAGASQEMHSYFRQSSVNLKEIIKAPGVWDPFVLSYVDMLEFYNDQEGALKVLNDYAYDSNFPSNPNAHVYLYDYLRRHNAPPKKLTKVLKVLHALVPSHELMLEFCTLLLQSKKACDLQKVLEVSLDLLDYICWRTSVNVWNNLMTAVSRLQSTPTFSPVIEELMTPRKSWWPALHFSMGHAVNEYHHDRELLKVKFGLVKVLCPCAREYSFTAGSMMQQLGSEVRPSRKRAARREGSTERDQDRERSDPEEMTEIHEDETPKKKSLSREYLSSISSSD